MTKDELRLLLEQQAQSFTKEAGGEVITYAAQREPERKPWRKKPSVQDEVFANELEKMAKLKAEQEAALDDESKF